MDWLLHGVSLILISLLDWMVYTLVSASYTVFLAVSEINLFATEGGAEVYAQITRQLYTVIGIGMIFVFAYQLLLLVINPDGNGKSSPSKLFKDTVISIIFIIVMPTIFNYMTLFQSHVLRNNTIPAIMLGTNASTDVGPGAGNKLAMMVYISFYHPQGTDYSTFYGTDGQLRSQPISGDCEDTEVCNTFMSALQSFESNYKISAITGVTALRHAIDSDTGMSYMWLVVTACGVAVIWFFISYAIDIGVRAVKLGFLQLIAPIPVMLRVFPNSKKTFETWLGEVTRTYLEIFIRLAVIFFIVRLCQLVPEFINAIFTSNDNISGNGLVKCVATVCLILGLLKFAKDAPDLIKAIFSTNGGLFSGLNLKPGVAKRMEDNVYGMKAMGAGMGALGGMVAGGYNHFKQSKNKNKGEGNSFKNNAKALGAGIVGATRGMLAGGKYGMEHQSEKFNRKDMMEAMYDATDVARNKTAKQTKLGKAVGTTAGEIGNIIGGIKQDGLQGGLREMEKTAGKIGEKAAEGMKKPFDRMINGTGSTKQIELVGKLQNKVDAMNSILTDEITRRFDRQKETAASSIGIPGGYQRIATFSYKADANGNISEEASKFLKMVKNTRGEAEYSAIKSQIMSGGYSETRHLTQDDVGLEQFKNATEEIVSSIEKEKLKYQSEKANRPEVQKQLQTIGAEAAKIISENPGYITDTTLAALSEKLSSGANVESVFKDLKKISVDGETANISAEMISNISQISDNTQIYSNAIKEMEAKRNKDNK